MEEQRIGFLAKQWQKGLWNSVPELLAMQGSFYCFAPLYFEISQNVFNVMNMQETIEAQQLFPAFL